MTKVKKYNIRSIFKLTRCDLVISKDKEKRLRQIVKELDRLDREMESLFTNKKGGAE